MALSSSLTLFICLLSLSSGNLDLDADLHEESYQREIITHDPMRVKRWVAHGQENFQHNGCPSADWHYAPEFNGCYLMRAAGRYAEAKKDCRQFDAVLAMARSDKETEILTDIMARDPTLIRLEEPNEGIWLGGTDKKKEGTWVWDNGEELQYTHWTTSDTPSGCKDKKPKRCLRQTKRKWFLKKCKRANSFQQKNCRKSCNLCTIAYPGNNGDCIRMLFRTGRWVDEGCHRREVGLRHMCFIQLYTECPQGWIYSTTLGNSRFCYFYNTTDDSFKGAKRSCNRLKANMVMPKHPEQNEFLKNIMNSPHPADTPLEGIWLGGVDRLNLGLWKWNDGSNFHWTNWFRGMQVPDKNNPTKKCTSMRKDGTWSDIECRGKRMRHVCFITLTQGCPDGWTYFHKTEACYSHRSTVKTNWYLKAQQDCANHGAVVAMARSPGEHNLVLNIGRSDINDTAGHIWLGAKESKNDPNVYKWVDGRPLGQYTFWKKGQPAHVKYNFEQHCAYMDAYDGRWSTSPCKSTDYRSYICMRESVGECPYGWTHNHMDQRCYKILKNPVRHFIATNQCYARGAQLAMPKDATTNAFLQDSLINYKKRFSGPKGFWIGASITPDGTGKYHWDDATNFTWTNFPGNPSNPSVFPEIRWYETCNDPPFREWKSGKIGRAYMATKNGARIDECTYTIEVGKGSHIKVTFLKTEQIESGDNCVSDLNDAFKVYENDALKNMDDTWSTLCRGRGTRGEVAPVVVFPVDRLVIDFKMYVQDTVTDYVAEFTVAVPPDCLTMDYDSTWMAVSCFNNTFLPMCSKPVHKRELPVADVSTTMTVINQQFLHLYCQFEIWPTPAHPTVKWTGILANDEQRTIAECADYSCGKSSSSAFHDESFKDLSRVDQRKGRNEYNKGSSVLSYQISMDPNKYYKSIRCDQNTGPSMQWNIVINGTEYLPNPLATVCPRRSPYLDPWVLNKDTQQCYVFAHTRKNFASKVEACQEIGGYLPEPRDAVENDFIRNLMMTGDPSIGKGSEWEGIYLAGCDRNNKDNWMSPNTGEPMVWTNWNRNQQNVQGYPEEKCISMRKDGLWAKSDCSNSRDFRTLCVRPGYTECRPGWALYGKYCYRYNNTASTYDDAARSCSSSAPGAHVARPIDFWSNVFLDHYSWEEFTRNGSNLRLLNKMYGIWIGKIEKRFSTHKVSWVDKSNPHLYTNWYPVGPGIHDCAYMEWKTGQWRTRNCDYKEKEAKLLRHVCAMPIRSSVDKVQPLFHPYDNYHNDVCGLENPNPYELMAYDTHGEYHPTQTRPPRPPKPIRPYRPGGMTSPPFIGGYDRGGF